MEVEGEKGDVTRPRSSSGDSDKENTKRDLAEVTDKPDEPSNVKELDQEGKEELSQPRIFIRNFEEIKENSDDDDEVFILGDNENVNVVQVDIRSREKKEVDASLPEDLMMKCEAVRGVEYRYVDPVLDRAKKKLSKWLERHKNKLNSSTESYGEAFPSPAAPASPPPSPRSNSNAKQRRQQMSQTSTEKTPSYQIPKQLPLSFIPVKPRSLAAPVSSPSQQQQQCTTASSQFFSSVQSQPRVIQLTPLRMPTGNVTLQPLTYNPTTGYLMQPAGILRRPSGNQVVYRNVNVINPPVRPGNTQFIQQRSPSLVVRSPQTIQNTRFNVPSKPMSPIAPQQQRYQPIAPRIVVPPSSPRSFPSPRSFSSPSPPPLPRTPGVQTARRASIRKTAIVTPSKTQSSPSGPVAISAGSQKPIPGTLVEDPSNDTGKTFPSLVVSVNPCLILKPNKAEQSKARSELDRRLKSVLTETPEKFTEWLLRRGLLRLNQKCSIHPQNLFQLGKYAAADRAPFSGGYIWNVPCCPQKPLSVFNRSILEGLVYPPGTVLKLIYHWACQTPINLVMQWCQVSSSFLREFYATLRAVCISWLHEKCPPMGGDGKCVEVGVITIGSSAETTQGSKNVTVEILGVFDPATKMVRLKVINGLFPYLLQDKESPTGQGARAFQILWALTHWVDKRSKIIIDPVIDPQLLRIVGFYNTSQSGSSSACQSSVITNYLRNVVPRLFNSTLSVLSKSLVQQFLDELSWREMFSITTLATYENIMDQISMMTKWDFPEEQSLKERLKKVGQNPFLDWSHTKRTMRSPLNTIPISLREKPGIKECVQLISKKEVVKTLPPPPPPVYKVGSTRAQIVGQPPNHQRKRKYANEEDDDVIILEQPKKPGDANKSYYSKFLRNSVRHSLQNYYYGGLKGQEALEGGTPFPMNLKCPLCIRTFQSNGDIVRHLFTHVSTVGLTERENSVCKVCLKVVPASVTMSWHLKEAHELVGAKACRICEFLWRKEEEQVTHMWHVHQRMEAPYKCELCGWASSFHHKAIQHHQERHGNEGNVMCPFCLQIMTITTLAGLKEVIRHLQIHANQQRRCKKCTRCCLSFVTELELERHLVEHKSRVGNGNWVGYQLAPGERVVMMAEPPVSLNPLKINPYPKIPPPMKKQRKSGEEKGKQIKSTLNVGAAVPLDTNAKFGGETFKIVVGKGIKGTCAECGEDVTTANHFVGKLFCTRCRFRTSCAKSMELHHERNHGCSKVRKPAFKTRPVKRLEEPMLCKCGFSCDHPTQLANHLIDCEKFTAYPKPKPVEESDAEMEVRENLETSTDTEEESSADNQEKELEKGRDKQDIGVLSPAEAQNDDLLEDTMKFKAL